MENRESAVENWSRQIRSDVDKLTYLYEEVFGHDDSLFDYKYERLIEGVSKSFDRRYQNLYEVVRLSYSKK